MAMPRGSRSTDVVLGDAELNAVTDGTSNDDDETDDWVLVPDEDKSAIRLPLRRTPLSRKQFYFQCQVKVGNRTVWSYDTRYDPHYDGSFSTKHPETKLETPLLLSAQEQSPLFALPFEIRLQIYNLVLQPVYADGSATTVTNFPSSPRPKPTILSILSTCRRVLYEAEHIFYANNRLRVDDPTFYDSLGPVRRSAVTALEVPGISAATLLETLEELHALPNLRSLRLVSSVSIDYINVSSWKVLMPQLVAQLEKLDQLEDFAILMPPSKTKTPPTANDTERSRKFADIEARLRQVVSSRRSSVAT